MERKALTLSEVLNLNRRPTLQEMVDLSDEDYTKYLYHKGIIKYIPENYDLLEEFGSKLITNGEELTKNYIPQNDIVYQLRQSWYGEDEPDNECADLQEGFILNESEEWNNNSIIEKDILHVNGKEVEYIIDKDNYLTLYEKYSNGIYSMNTGIVYYLMNKNF